MNNEFYVYGLHVKKRAKVRFTIELSGSANDALEHLAEASGGNKSEVLRKAIALLEVAATAKKKGHRLAVADENSRIVHTIIGL